MTDYLGPYDAATAALAGIVAEYTTAGVALPTSFVTVGMPAYDGEMIAVSISREFGVPLASGWPNEGVSPERCLFWRGVEFVVHHLRCAPTGTVKRDEYVPPTPSDYDKVAKVVMQDAGIIKTGLVKAAKAGDFGEGWVFSLLSWEAIPPEGGYQGGMLTFRVGLT